MRPSPMPSPQHQLGRQVIASYDSYPEAQRAVESLSDRKFPAEHLSIVGEGLEFVEVVTGRSGWGRALAQGAGSGALTGALIGFVFGLLSWANPLLSGLTVAVYGLLVGGAIGAILGLVTYAFADRRRGFSSIRTVRADHYDIVCDASHADEAARLLGSGGADR